jgi:hypothetical protein
MGLIAGGLQARSLYIGLTTGVLPTRAGQINFDRRNDAKEFWTQVALGIFLLVFCGALVALSIYVLIAPS